MTPEQIEYIKGFPEADRARFMDIYSAWIGLGVAGCDTCEFASEVNKHIKPVEDQWGVYSRLSSVTHLLSN